jgi:acetylornithine deacetylase/succinyl-diaminopimelate desuccinylase-like protein
MMRDALHHDTVRSLAQHLISIESHVDALGREAEIGRFLVGWFRDRGIDVELQPVDGDRANVIARIPGDGGPSMILNGHLDTVPAGDMPDAFTPRIENGTLWGRGACDMKGSIAAMCVAMATLHRDKALERSYAPQGVQEAPLRLGDSRPGDVALHRDKALGRSFAPQGDPEAAFRSVGGPAKGQSQTAVRGPDGLRGDLIFAGTVDEESGSLGVKALVEAGITADYAIVGEPTSLRVAVAHKGSCFVKVSLTGCGAHGSCPEQGVNAVSYAARIVAAVEDELRPRLSERMHPLLGSSTASVGRICGGTQPNIVAETCEIEIDRRYLPGEASPVPEIREIVASICDGTEGLSYDIVETPMTSRVPHVPLGTSPDSAIARASIESCRQAGLPAEPVGVAYWSDGGHLAASGIETIVLGPGDIANAHGPRDRVAIEELCVAVKLYREIAMRLLSGAT